MITRLLDEVGIPLCECHDLPLMINLGRNGKVVHRNTWRYRHTVGVNGVRVDAIRVGNRLFTTVEEVRRWLMKVSATEQGGSANAYKADADRLKDWTLASTRKLPESKSVDARSFKAIAAGVARRLDINTPGAAYKLAKSWSYERVVGGKSVHVARVARFECQANPHSANNPAGNRKQFRTFLKLGNTWESGTFCGLWPVLYEPEIAASTGLVIVNEGEGKADICRDLGFTATSAAQGVGASHGTDWKILAGRDVAILLDNDEPGETFGNSVATILTALQPPARVKLIKLPGLAVGGDVKDWVQAGGTAEALRQMIDAAPITDR